MQDPSRLFSTFLVATCVEQRERADADRNQVAHLVGVKEVTVERFEKGKNFPKENLERFAAAYAALDDEDPRDLILRAVDRWKHIGRPPLTAPAERALGDGDSQDHLSPAAILERIRIAERAERAHAQAAKRPTSTRKKRANGG